MKTYMAKPETVERKWYVIDVKGQVVGRAATQIATILRGKHKPTYTPHVDTGDHVIVLNADKVVLTGKKMDQKMYWKHTGYIGGLRETSARKMMDKKPEYILQHAVVGMLPHNALGRKMAKKLRVYCGDTHEHAAQMPEVLVLK